MDVNDLWFWQRWQSESGTPDEGKATGNAESKNLPAFSSSPFQFTDPCCLNTQNRVSVRSMPSIPPIPAHNAQISKPTTSWEDRFSSLMAKVFFFESPITFERPFSFFGRFSDKLWKFHLSVDLQFFEPFFSLFEWLFVQHTHSNSHQNSA
jgi:hypothetical protein